MENVMAISGMPTGPGDRPRDEVKIESLKIYRTA
jgi:hypothetical protein